MRVGEALLSVLLLACEGSTAPKPPSPALAKTEPNSAKAAPTASNEKSRSLIEWPSNPALASRVIENLHIVAERSILPVPGREGDVSRFRPQAPIPSERPWLKGSTEQFAGLTPDTAGSVRERYEVVRCPGEYFRICAEVWVTGLLRANARDPVCVGARITNVKGKAIAAWLPSQELSSCPLARAPNADADVEKEERRVIIDREF